MRVAPVLSSMFAGFWLLSLRGESFRPNSGGLAAFTLYLVLLTFLVRVIVSFLCRVVPACSVDRARVPACIVTFFELTKPFTLCSRFLRLLLPFTLLRFDLAVVPNFYQLH